MITLLGAAPGDTPDKPKADSSVAELQRTLKAYADLVHYPAADPGPVDGIVGTQTATAVLMVIPRIPKIPDEVRALAMLGPLALSNADLRAQMFKTITSYASYISAAIIAAQVGQAIVGDGSAAPPTVGGKRPAAVSAASQLVNMTMTGWQTQAAPGGGTIPTNPASAIFFWDFWTQRYRVAVPRGAGLGAGGYVNYVEVAPAQSRPATGTEVSRNAFMHATGKWWGTTAGIVGLTLGVVAAGGAAYAGVQAIRR